MSTYTFTSESVSAGHPDKVADQISDAILDAYLAEDPKARVACETLVKDNRIILAGEVRSSARVDHQAIARQTVCELGYDSDDLEFNGATADFIDLIGAQAQEINQGVDREDPSKQGAGDQGLVFGYASDETTVLLPAPIYFAHCIIKRLNILRLEGIHGLRPDAKAQVSIRYEGDIPVAISDVVTSTQHDASVSQKDLSQLICEHVYPYVFEQGLLSEETKIHINPTGSFVVGGPVGDCGLTGRKIIVDTYGGFGRHGGGAFSGKDPSKVDRSAAYAARQVAVSVIKNGLAKRCEVQISYAIGVAEPTSVYVNTFGTGLIADAELEQKVIAGVDLTPYGITQRLQLERPIYRQTAAYGHFGRDDIVLPWEQAIAL